MLTHFKTKLLSKRQLASDIWEFRFEHPGHESFQFKAGQYMILKVGDLRRLYSISSAEYQAEFFELVVQIVIDGVGSKYLINLNLGDCSDFMGPAGLFTKNDPIISKHFLATGTGIAPIKSKIYTLLHQEETEKDRITYKLPEINLFWGLKTMKDAYYTEEFLALTEKHPNFHFYLCLTRETDESLFEKAYVKKGRVTEVLQQFHPDQFPINYEYHVCGGREMVSTTVEFLKEKGIPKEYLYFEKF